MVRFTDLKVWWHLRLKQILQFKKPPFAHQLLSRHWELRLSHKDEKLTKTGVSLFGTWATTSKIQMPWLHSDPNTSTSCPCHGDYPFSIESLQEDTEDLALAIRLQSLTRSDWAHHEHEIQQGETSSPSLEAALAAEQLISVHKILASRKPKYTQEHLITYLHLS